VVFSLILACSEGKTTMFLSPNDEQTIVENQKGIFVASAIESFLMDRRAAGLSHHTVKFCRQFLRPFLAYCAANALKLVQDVTADFLRRYSLALAETHNPGGVHASFRRLRASFRWGVDKELMPVDWKNPMLKVKAPKVANEMSTF
jgi:site-specific recombinase XerD